MPEAELTKLVQQYHEAVSKYAKAVERLTGLKGPDFERAYQNVEHLRQATERCRAALEKYSHEG